MKKVIVGMSGGVDSSVTAYLLRERGFEVEGVSFVLWEARNRLNFSACCSSEATDSASKTAECLGVRHSTLDVREEFIEKVIEPFVDAYARGLTPNPCILCNRHIKFPFLLDEARRRGAEYIATGHYARTERRLLDELRSEQVLLKKGIDQKKDQSYVLYVLKPHEIEGLVLPLGDLVKTEVRELARSLHLPAADRAESQEICFVGEENYSHFVEGLSTSVCSPGPIVDMSGKELGTHKGVYRYTLGQRKGLGLSSREPFYVTAIDTTNNVIRVGSQDEAMMRHIMVSDLNWLMPPPSGSFRTTVKVRSMMEDRPAVIETTGDKAEVLFDEPQWAPAPGQSAVFYNEDAVLGGGVIEPSRTQS